jgi:glycosyltransferase involved in cell wall biosynthesis
VKKTTIVVPCYNEAARLPVDLFSKFVDELPDIDFILVNDGSRDSTLSLLQGLEARNPERFSVLDQNSNQGKAEAVRIGMNAAFERGSDYVGYFDADLATPLQEIPRLRAVLDENQAIQIVLGSRVQLLGRHIQRQRVRHYLGRVFATVASESLGLRVYDTQCGAKIFRSSALTRSLFVDPFVTNWVFDVEILARLIAATRKSTAPPAEEIIFELPLNEWVDIAGSRVRPIDFVRAIFEICQIYKRYLGRSAISS